MRAMPTFMVFRAGDKLGEVTGANAAGLQVRLLFLFLCRSLARAGPRGGDLRSLFRSLTLSSTRAQALIKKYSE